MNKLSIIIATALLYILTVSSSHAADGKAIYSQSCNGCHGTEVFTRPNRRMKSYADLKKQVRRCSYAIEAKWFDSEINAVTDYLNSAFYKF